MKFPFNLNPGDEHNPDGGNPNGKKKFQPQVEFVSLHDLLKMAQGEIHNLPQFSKSQNTAGKPSQIMDNLQDLRNDIFAELQRIESIMTRLKHNPEAEDIINSILALSDEP